MPGTPKRNLSDPSLWASPAEVDATFARLRREEPVSWQAEPASPGFEAGRGYWAVVRHEDVLAVGTDPARFSSAPTTSIRDLPPELGEFFGSMLAMDDPRHAQLRRVVSRAFTRQRLDHTREAVTRLAHELVGRACARGTCDVVEAIAAPLPLLVICDLMGVPEADRDAVAAHSEALGLARGVTSLAAAATALHECASRLAAERRAHPGDDLTSVLVRADVDGESLTPTEVGSFFMLLVVAGAQTTRHAISQGIAALGRHYDQRELWIVDPDGVTPTAVEEVVRWATPVRHFRRTATEDTTLAGVDIAAGDKVVMWYSSANRDEAAFPGADRFDVTRRPNPHVAFGAGPHYCLGANLARHEVAAALTALLGTAPTFSVLDAAPLASSFLDGHAHLTCDLPT